MSGGNPCGLGSRLRLFVGVQRVGAWDTCGIGEFSPGGGVWVCMGPIGGLVRGWVPVWLRACGWGGWPLRLCGVLGLGVARFSWRVSVGEVAWWGWVGSACAWLCWWGVWTLVCVWVGRSLGWVRGVAQWCGRVRVVRVEPVFCVFVSGVVYVSCVASGVGCLRWGRGVLCVLWGRWGRGIQWIQGAGCVA